jgi:hypothetical protein
VHQEVAVQAQTLEEAGVEEDHLVVEVVEDLEVRNSEKMACAFVQLIN